ncbi:OLC1v1037802C2 [Oldenlandia corymbosa var. corymbosa]|uniref:OLC1v1037802C2 n=1 Tax=Oldenlandia corymbosa var. corymbosa TaxID=529605 RepID=A0AAV1CYV5_OLDCO|nr:OLC1v1037802C2 [Oldenlandia corymbosa var. corymbosa]
MVWFQCEDCGDNLKKPKLPGHFRMCSASKLSCIDCGEVFGQHNVESHTQCITEAEKYGPKGQGKATSNSNSKANSASKQKPDIDLNVGLSKRAPWSCSLCNTTVTSQQTLLLHAEGKKHIAKAKAFHASKQQLKEEQEPLLNIDGDAKTEAVQSIEKQDEEKSSDVATKQAENGNLPSNKKRKLEAPENGQKPGVDTATELGNGEVIQVRKKVKGTVSEDEKADCTPRVEDKKKKIKWKKLITSSLQSNSNGRLKLKKLIKLVLNSLKESGHAIDESQVSEILERKINSSSRFDIDGKYVQLAVKN